jgi:hypothetical protein
MKLCPRILRDEMGWNITSWWDIYPDEDDNDVEDEVWIPVVVERGLHILGQDDAMRRKPIIRDTIINNAAHVFALTRADLTGRQRAERFNAVRDDIYRRTTLPGYAYFTLGGDLQLRRKTL